MTVPYYEFRIALIGVRPMVWRWLRIARRATFWDLHVAIQDVMGWEDSHLHAFRVVDPESRLEETIGIPDDEDPSTHPGWAEFIEDYLRPQLQPIALYEYDFGDGWVHEVVLEEWGQAPQDELPACTGGARACPPEDFGGPYLYSEAVEAWLDVDHPDHDSWRAQLGAEFDPEHFDPAKVEFLDPQQRWREVFEDEDDFDLGAPSEGEQDGDDAVDVRELLQLLQRDALIGGVIEDLGPLAEDVIRYRSLAVRFETERERRGLTVKDVAQRLKVAQYRVTAVEGRGLSSLRPDVQVAYARFLGIEGAMREWSIANPESARRMGIGGATAEE